MSQSSNIASFVKYHRKMLNLTQEQLAEKAGVGLRFIRDLEQGKESLRLDKVNQVLQLFGHRLTAFSEKLLDPWEILWKYLNKAVEISLRDRTKLTGMLLEEVMHNQDIVGWQFVLHKDALEYNRTENPALLRMIDHNEIESIKEL